MDVGDIDPDPIKQFERWLAEAAESLPEPTAMVLATADARAAFGPPRAVEGHRRAWVRVVHELRERQGSRAAVTTLAPRSCFPWFPIRRQVIVSGTVSMIDEGESDAYFAPATGRARSARGRHRRAKSFPIDSGSSSACSRSNPGSRGAMFPARTSGAATGSTPDRIDFWYNQPDRLHDRFRYERTMATRWSIHAL